LSSLEPRNIGKGAPISDVFHHSFKKYLPCALTGPVCITDAKVKTKQLLLLQDLTLVQKVGVCHGLNTEYSSKAHVLKGWSPG
jgi:hypothetical protein